MEEVGLDRSLCGGKGIGLAHLIRVGVNVPEGFIIPATAYDAFVKSNDLESKICAVLEKN